MIPDYLEQFKLWELWELANDEEELYTHELQSHIYEEETEIKLTKKFILNAWEFWMAAEDQTEDESRSEAFEEIKNCEERLFLRYMSLSTIPNVFPCGLTELYLIGNELTQIPNNLPETLEILNMNRNQLCTMSGKFPSNLRELFMSRNNITSIPDLPDSLKRLYLYENKLTWLPNNLPKSLCYLDADNNDIKFLPETLPEMLIEIRIRYNELVCLPEQLPKSLKNLYLSGNHITKLKLNHESIIVLYLDDNEIQRIFEENFNLPKLQVLFLSNNKLDILPTNLPDTLEYLQASNNKISEILTDWPKALKNLNLDGNNITVLPKKLPPQLEQLNLSYNKITEITPMEVPVTMEIIILSNNLITDISSSFENFLNAITIYLGGNPLSEVSLEYLRQLIRTSGVDILFDGSTDYYENFVETLPLIEELENWLDIELIHPYWNTISEETVSRPFSRFLYRIRQTSNFEVAKFKEDVSKWLSLLGEDNNSQKKLREKIFLVAAEANESCDHRVVWSLNQMMILSIAQDVELGKYDNKIEELVGLARGMYRLNVLDQISRQTVRNLENACDEIEIYLEYQIRLSEVFDLPISTAKMSDDYSFVLLDVDIERAFKEIVHKERIEFIDYLLLDWQPWKEVLKRWNSDQFVKCENDIRNEEIFKQSLDKRRAEYLLETNMSDELLLDIDIQLGIQVQRKIEKDIWLKFTNELLDSKHLGSIERL